VIVFVFLPVKEKKKITLVLHQEISSPRFAGLKTGLLKYFSSGETLHVFLSFQLQSRSGLFSHPSAKNHLFTLILHV